MTTSVLGPLRDPFPDVRRIAVLRGGALGDLLFAVPALYALAAAYPAAEITLLGAPLATELLAGQPVPDEVVVVPPIAGVRAATDAEPEDAARRERFVAAMRERRFDLAVQLHGGGANSNPLLLDLGARHTVGSAAPDAPPLERTVPYRIYQHEMLRGLEVAGLAGAAPVMLEPRLEVAPDAVAVARTRLATDAAGLVVLHPGANDPRRRWPAASFAEVALPLARGGVQVLVVGGPDDVPAADEIVARVRAGQPDAPVASLAGAQRLGELAALLSLADVMLGNDSGPRHLALAVGTPTVGIFWVGNALSAEPLTRERHRVLLGWVTACPVCGRDATRTDVPRCEHHPSYVADVRTDEVLAEVRDLLGSAGVTATSPRARGR